MLSLDVIYLIANTDRYMYEMILAYFDDDMMQHKKFEQLKIPLMNQYVLYFLAVT